MTIKIGVQVRVHSPVWVDATGRSYDPGKNHGRVGTVAEVTDHKVGNECLYAIDFNDGKMTYPHWTNELRVVKGEVSNV